MNDDIVTFAFKSRQHNSAFHQELGDVAQVEIITEPTTGKHKVKVKPILTQVIICLYI